MITDFILHGIFLIVQFLLWPLQGLSDATLSPSITSAISSAASYINLYASIFPTTTLWEILAALLVVELVIFLTKGIIFGIKKIPFVG